MERSSPGYRQHSLLQYVATGALYTGRTMTGKSQAARLHDAAQSRADALPAASEQDPWARVAERVRSRGLRWTPQWRTLIEVLREHHGHVTATELISRCRSLDPTTTPSTVYRTLDLLEEMDLVRHGHTPDGREEYHVLPDREHGHLHCAGCGHTWEIDPQAGAVVAQALEAQLGFAVDLSHVTISGWCAGCRPSGSESSS
jgi:Fur family ferric uptake transcriptional regulator